MRFFLLLVFIAGSVFAQSSDLERRFKSFPALNGKAVFVDFQSADYEIVYDAQARQAVVVASIKFNAPEAGFPVFDSVTAPQSLSLDGQPASATLVTTPNRETSVRVINTEVKSGSHSMIISVPLTTLVEYRDGGVRSAFWTSDLEERQFLERYMPASFEYDRVKMTFKISFLGVKAKQKIYTNGTVSEVKSKDGVSYKITYPDYFNASSIFFHTVPEGTTDELRFVLKSIDGREIPSVVYFGKTWNGLSSLSRLKDLTTEIFQELEADYGPWPHQSIIVYNAGQGGMEYCGATMTSVSALGHELFHSYFARGVMPANGNSGWIDEALASWRDDGYQTTSILSGTSMMSNHPYYTRTTDMAAYSFGERFMRYLDGKLKSKGGLKPFMRHMVEHRRFSPFFVENFQKEMSAFYGVSVEEDFKKYTYGSRNAFGTSQKSTSHKIHRRMSLEELRNFL